jgi:hypothetical protein
VKQKLGKKLPEEQIDYAFQLVYDDIFDVFMYLIGVYVVLHFGVVFSVFEKIRIS